MDILSALKTLLATVILSVAKLVALLGRQLAVNLARELGIA
jgi:hypothetical protein